MVTYGRQTLQNRSQEWRDRLRWVKLVRDEQPMMSVHLIVRRHVNGNAGRAGQERRRDDS